MRRQVSPSKRARRSRLQLTALPTLISRLRLLLRPSLHSHALVPLRHIVARRCSPQRRRQANVSCNYDAERGEETQFSSCRCSTRSNSFVLFVTRIRFSDIACAAIKVSKGPMGVPAFSSFERTSPYTDAALSANGKIVMGERNCINAILFCFGKSLFATPCSNSA